MAYSYKGGFIRLGYEPFLVPDAPLYPTATDQNQDGNVSVSFATAGSGGSAITTYYAVSSPDGITGNATSSPVYVNGLTNGTAYTFKVWAENTYGPGPQTPSSNSATPSAQTAYFFASGTNIEYVKITSLGNTTDFGDKLTSLESDAAVASTTRGVYKYYGNQNSIEYITLATGGTASDFGDFSWGLKLGTAGVGNDTRGVFFGGEGGTTSFANIIEYITIASAGNSTDFGDALTGRAYVAGCQSTTRGIYSGGDGGGAGNQNVIQYITIASAGNATDFGDLTANSSGGTGCSSSTRGLLTHGLTGAGSRANIIEYITIASAGNSTDFGDLTVWTAYHSSTSSKTRGLFTGGYGGTSSGGPFAARKNIDYVTIASTGNASNFGDLVATTFYGAGASNCHGGLA